MMMDWNAKTPSLWDWESPILFGGNHKQDSVDRAIDCSASEPGNPSSSKSSIDSSSHAGIGTSSFSIEAFPNFGDIRESSPAAVRPQEPVIGLKLGKRTYFEDVCPGSGSVRNPASSSSASSSPSVKRSRVSPQSMQSFRCQVEGCNVDLTGAKEYHRKHRVCESHAKCPRVIIAGQERRFCQQCSRFHDLSAFDEKKRSCRKRLSDHNARRRKPQPGTISSNSASLPSSFYDDRQQMSFLFNEAPFSRMRPSASSTWEGLCDFKLAHVKGSWIKSTKGGDIEPQLLLPSTNLSNSISTLPRDLDKLFPFKGITAEVLNQGREASMVAPNLNGAPDIHALSLLSMDSWGLAGPSSSLAQQPQTINCTSTAQPAIHAALHYWQDEQPPPQQARDVLPFATHSNGSQFQLRKAPYEAYFL